MGLSGRKIKQRIPADPRNLSWANDANKFGTAYMQKLGWSPDVGLGPSGAGRTTHIAVSQKLDMLGIGADHRNSQDGTAWKQSREFEALLQRLNAQAGPDAPEEVKVDGFVRAQPEAGAGDGEGGEDVQAVKKKSKGKKRAADDGEDGEDERKAKKKRTKAKDAGEGSDEEARKAKKEKKKRRRDALEEAAEAAPSGSTEDAPRAVAPRPLRAHRTRHIASKALASKSPSAISEILGLAPTPPPASTSASPYPAPVPADGVVLQELTTSSKSVMDYFREKLAAKSSTHASASTSEAVTPAARERDEEEERPRLGLGASRPQAVVQASVVVEVDAEPAAKPAEERDTQRKDKKGKRRMASDESAVDEDAGELERFEPRRQKKRRADAIAAGNETPRQSKKKRAKEGHKGRHE